MTSRTCTWLVTAIPAVLLLLAGCSETVVGPDAVTESRMDWSADVASSSNVGWQVGDIVPDALAFDRYNATVALSDFAGNFILLEVTAAWCGPSKYMAAFMADVEATLGAEGKPFTHALVLTEGVAPGIPSTAAHASAWLNTYESGADGEVYHVNGSADVAAPWWDAILAQASGGTAGIPVLYLLGPGGEVLRVNVGAFDAGYLTQWVREGIDAYVPPLTPEEQLGTLLEEAVGTRGISTGSVAMLRTAQMHLQENRSAPACTLLRQFIEDVNRQRGLSIAPEDASALVGLAVTVSARMGCS